MNYTMTPSTKGFLLPEEIHFFYYDVMRATEDSTLFIYDWNSDDVKEFLNKKIVIIVTKETLPDKVMKDEMYFIIEKIDEENIAAAFFSHLRNAFAHFRIVHESEYLNITDGSWKGKEEDKYFERTMIGQIKYEDLKELCFLFFKQKEKFIEENNIYD